MTRAENGTALITGASSGIGAVYADRLAHRGYDLVLVARDAARMEALAAGLRAKTGRSVDVIRADLTDEAELKTIEERLGSDSAITVLVNNAGMSMHGGVLEAEASEMTRLIALNITAVTRLAAAAGKAFAQRGAGTIINLASVLALAPERFDGVYSGSKAYVINLSLSLDAQLKEKGVRVQAVLPGATRTEIWERSGKDVDAFPADWVMDVSDLVDAALVGLDSGETVTIPPLAEEGLWTAFVDARLAMDGHLSSREVAPRYRKATAAAA